MTTWQKSQSFLEAFRYASTGLKDVYKTQRNLRIQFAFFLLAVVASLVLHISRIEFLFVLMSSALVMALECINTGLEFIEDTMWPEYSESVKRSKDALAGAVLVASISALLIGATIFLPALYSLLVY